jgi:hypothetical protein
MKRFCAFCIAVVFFAVTIGAQPKTPQNQPAPTDTTKNSGPMCGKGMGMGGKMEGMPHMMMGGAMEMLMPKVYPTSDGGAIVVAGNTITKYDQNLNVKKQVIASPNLDSLKALMNKVMSNMPKCPMMQDTTKKK